jgi:bla regulator protein BlaR1
MLRELTSHLCQSTFFGAVVALLIFAFRRNRAQVRYWLWFSASFKFFIPFSLLASLGRHLAWAPVAHRVATHMTAPAFGFAVAPIIDNFPDPLRFASTEGGANWVLVALAGLWTCGLVGIAFMRLNSYRARPTRTSQIFSGRLNNSSA